MTTDIDHFVTEVERSAPDYGLELTADAVGALSLYYQKLLQWNPQLHLVAQCAPEVFARRHVLESLFATRYISMGAAVVDIGSGGGLPIIPVLIARPDASATLIEASAKKAVFLQEACRSTLKLNRPRIVPRRFQDIESPRADYLTCRALENFTELTGAMFEWANRIDTLLLFGGDSLAMALEALTRNYESVLLPGSSQRYLFVVKGCSTPVAHGPDPN